MPKVEALGHPGCPPPLGDAVVKFSSKVLSPVNDLLTFLFFGLLVSLNYSRKILCNIRALYV